MPEKGTKITFGYNSYHLVFEGRTVKFCICHWPYLLWGITGDTSIFFCSSVTASASFFVFIPSFNEANVPILDQQNMVVVVKGLWYVCRPLH